MRWTCRFLGLRRPVKDDVGASTMRHTCVRTVQEQVEAIYTGRRIGDRKWSIELETGAPSFVESLD